MQVYLDDFKKCEFSLVKPPRAVDETKAIGASVRELMAQSSQRDE